VPVVLHRTPGRLPLAKLTLAAPHRSAITFRPQNDGDREFLRTLYASTREEELRVVPWTEDQKAAFLNMQFEAQSSDYAKNYPDCSFDIMEMDGQRIGRLYVDRLEDAIEIIDIALLPAFRGRGIGRLLLEEILAEATDSKRAVRIYVEHFNPARHLYDRLGFRHIDTNGVYHLMEWRSGVS
jgi:ribosomal protein S18 acetylase RimI-like enzyme